MYGETGLLLPYFQSFSQEVQHLDEFYPIQKSCGSMSNLVHISSVSDYDLGGEGDLFKAPEPVIGEPDISLDPLTAVSMGGGEDGISLQTMTDLESFQNEQLFNDVFYDCEKELLAKSAIEEHFSDISDVKIPIISTDEDQIEDKNRFSSGGPIQKSVSSGCLSSTECLLGGTATRPNFLDFQLVFEDAYGMRRAFSDGDIQSMTIRKCMIEERKQKLSRYRKKRTKRNFGRKIKYACRKALADNQPRVRGRFAKTEELAATKK